MDFRGFGYDHLEILGLQYSKGAASWRETLQYKGKSLRYFVIKTCVGGLNDLLLSAALRRSYDQSFPYSQRSKLYNGPWTEIERKIRLGQRFPS